MLKKEKNKKSPAYVRAKLNRKLGRPTKAFMSYKQAQHYLTKQGITTSTQFLQWIKSGKRPDSFPSTPWSIYKKQWKGWKKFSKQKGFMSYKQAQQYITKQDITTLAQFLNWIKSGKRPDNFPSNPWLTYKAEWEGWKKFAKQKKFMSYEQAQQYIAKQGITTSTQFLQWIKSGKRPDNFPSNPWLTYTQWEGWKKFLKQKGFMSYEQAQQYITKQRITTLTQFFKWRQSGKRPDNFPSNPWRKYKKQWKGWKKFAKNSNKKKFMSYEQAQQYITKRGITTSTQFLQWIKSGKRPNKFPSNPWIIYKAEWEGWKKFLKQKNFISYGQAQEYIIKQGIATSTQFLKWSKSIQRPDNFPSSPWSIYKAEWKGWKKFLKQKGFMSYEQAQQYITKQGITTLAQFLNWNKSGKRPDNFPSNPWITYKTEWKGWKKFIKLKKSDDN